MHFSLLMDFLKKIVSGTLSECQNSLDQDQDPQCVGPDLAPSCLQRLSAENKSLARKGLSSLLTYFGASLSVTLAMEDTKEDSLCRMVLTD